MVKSGVNDVIVKPIPADLLRKKIGALFKSWAGFDNFFSGGMT